MKKFNRSAYLLISVIILINTACRKDINEPGTAIGGPPASPPQTDQAPVVNAGADIRLEIPVTSTVLQASAVDVNQDIKNFNWRKISGPESYFLEWPTYLSPKLIWLEEGEYEFEFTATDMKGLFDKDTVKITVFSGLKKFVLHNLTPDSLWFSTAQIPAEVKDNLKWVFVKSAGSFHIASAGQVPGIDYSWGDMYYYELLPGNLISVYGYTGYNLDIIIYY